MSDLMRPVSLRELIYRIFAEYRKSKTIFGIREEHFYRPSGDKRISVFGETCDTPLGPAAGPHTQLTQNIIASYLVGGRFMELKTVQIMDTLEIPKPCIDPEDEGYNTEWSTEFTLHRAYDEYVKGWVILHILDEFFGFRKGNEKSFIFNMSVGYDLEGIKTDRMQEFIHGLTDASTQDLLDSYRKELKEIFNDQEIIWAAGEKSKDLAGIGERISDKICRSVTLSTMHGCPPAEIEAICRYMLTEKKLPTFVKLNPTLLGYDTVRNIMDELGYDYLSLSREAFDHDLQYPDAIAMLGRLKKLAEDQGIGFGMKLTNTLGAINNKGVLPGDEMYMSGRALYPLSINLAAKLSAEFNGAIPVSFAGGARIQNMKGIFDAGIQPITMATEMLKPGGYTRLKDSIELLETEPTWRKEKIDVEFLKKLAKSSLTADYSRKEWRGNDQISVPGPLPLFDCYVAPCVQACPIKQDIPEYVRLVGEKRYKEALEVIYDKNALPSITGHICDHQCQYNCTRLDYEGTVKIREMKKIAVENGWKEYRASWKTPESANGKPAAVIGAGPAGLSAAFFLAREGRDVTIFEKAADAGGVVANVIPKFRIPREAILRDIDYIRDHGVKFVFGADNINLDGLKEKGFDKILLAVGAEKGNHLSVENSDGRMTEALDFLKDFRTNPSGDQYGKHIAVVGGGNTAMDSARAAKRLPGVEDVTVIYRRTEKEMPADREEYLEALEEGIGFNFLSHPVGFNGETLTVRKMKLGEPDESGRRRPEPTDETCEIMVSHIVAAIGEKADSEMLKDMGLSFKGKAPAVDPETCATETAGVYLLGDARTGPSTIVACIAEGRKAADHILAAEGTPAIGVPVFEGTDTEAIYSRKPRMKKSLPAADVQAFAETEGARCLECSYVCDKCVEVCPNRANIVIKMDGFEKAGQILHIDAFCNECGNCGSFCPWNGNPYKDKLTIFNLTEDFDNSTNPGFYWNGIKGFLRLDGTVYNMEKKDGEITASGDSTPEKEAVLSVIKEVEKEHSYLLGPVIMY